MGVAVSPRRNPCLQTQYPGSQCHSSRAPAGVWFMVTEMTPQSVNGWLPENLWEYVNDPPKAWSRELFKKLSTTPPDLAADRQGYARRPQPG